MTITFQTERYLDARAEAQALVEAHWNEVALNREVIPLSLDHVSYAKLDERGQLLIIAARDGGRLVGYCIYLIMPQGPLHYLGTPWAETDAFFVAPEDRSGGIGRGLILNAEDHLRARGVRVVHTHVKNDHPAAGKLLEALGHKAIETIYAKVLN